MKVLLLTIFLLPSCAQYVNNLHRQIDNEEQMKRRQRQMARQNAAKYRNRNYRPVQAGSPVTLSNTGSPTNMLPPTQRDYQPMRKRVTSDDLKDNSTDASLWSGQSSESFLFVTNNFKKTGDIVIVEVMKDLKEKIQEELKRRFPEIKRRKKKGEKDTENKEEEKKEEVATTTEESKDKVYDKISTSVIETINQDYLLIKGQKEVLFRDVKRYLEIQTVVSQKDINTDDTVASQKLLEPKINVLR